MDGAEIVEHIGRAQVGVLAYVRSNGAPAAVAVTPFAVDGRLVVTSTLAFVDKAAALRRDARLTLTGAGVTVSGRATVEVDPTPAFFDAHIRAQELRKYPPSRVLLAVPGHRCILPWYVGRVVVWIEPDAVDEQSVPDDRITVTVVGGDGRLRTTSIDLPQAALDGERVHLGPGIGDGPAALLVHDQDERMRALRQLSLHGSVEDGTLRVDGRRGALDALTPSAAQQVRDLRAMGRRATANRERLATWPVVAAPLNPPSRRGPRRCGGRR